MSASDGYPPGYVKPQRSLRHLWPDATKPYEVEYDRQQTELERMEIEQHGDPRQCDVCERRIWRVVKTEEGEMKLCYPHAREVEQAQLLERFGRTTKPDGGNQ